MTYAATQQRIIFLIFVLFHQTQQSERLLQEMQQYTTPIKFTCALGYNRLLFIYTNETEENEMLEVKVTKRDSELTKGIFKVGTVIDLDLEDMVVYHSGMEWNVVRTDNGFKLPGSETYFAAV